MVMWEQLRPLYPLISLLVFTFLTPIITYFGRTRNRKYVGGIWVSLSFLVALILLITLYKDVVSQPIKSYFVVSPPLGVEFKVDLLSLLFSLVFAFIGFCSALSSIRYMEEETGLDTYYMLFQLMVLGMIGVTFSNDLFNLFVFWEIMCISSYVLVSFRKYHWEAVEAGFKYLIMSSFGSVALLLLISYLYGVAGTLNFDTLHQIVTGSKELPIYYFLIGLTMVAFGIKAAVVPFHTWLADAHPAAPTPISAMLSGVVIKAGVFALLKTYFVVFSPAYFNYGIMILVLGILTMTVANLMALLQEDIKRLLAYSSIVNIGFIVTGIGVAAYVLSSSFYFWETMDVAVFAVIGALFHFLNHALGKGLLFLCSGCFIHELKTREIAKMFGIGRKMPWTGFSFSVGLLGLGGVPPLNGFWSKLIIIWSAWLAYKQVGGLAMPITIAFLVFNAVFAVTYYVRLIQLLVVREPEQEVRRAHRPPASMVVPLIILAVSCIVIGVYPGLVLGFIESSAKVLVNLVLR